MKKNPTALDFLLENVRRDELNPRKNAEPVVYHSLEFVRDFTAAVMKEDIVDVFGTVSLEEKDCVRRFGFKSFEIEARPVEDKPNSYYAYMIPTKAEHRLDRLLRSYQFEFDQKCSVRINEMIAAEIRFLKKQGINRYPTEYLNQKL